jgi:hypothetical protein
MQKMPHLERQKNYVRMLIQQALKINLFSPQYSWKIAELALNINHSLNYSWTQNVRSILAKESR